MIDPNSPSLRSVACRAAMVALACAFIPALAQFSPANAAESHEFQPLDDKAPSLPLTAAFEKGTDPEVGPYVLKLKNVSGDSLKVRVKIHLSVAFHANNKDRSIPEHAIDAGQVWSISDLAAGDKVVVKAAGFAPLELTVP